MPKMVSEYKELNHFSLTAQFGITAMSTRLKASEKYTFFILQYLAPMKKKYKIKEIYSSMTSWSSTAAATI